MKGYLKNPKATKEALAGGWFHTGDLAVLNPDGYIKIKDRSKDIIISGGKNISTVTAEELVIHCKNYLPSFKVPKAVEFCELSKTATGKIQKFELRKLVGATKAIDV